MKIKDYPENCGVYIMKDKNTKVLYVGKANNLKKRVASYFRQKGQSVKTKHLIQKVTEIDYIITNSELEALLLESNLIKEKKPRYNILLKDNKSYPFIKVTIKENYPRVFKTRQIAKDGSRYFGPYANAGLIHRNLKFMQQLFPIRSCDFDLEKQKVEPCLDYYIKKCGGCCIGQIEIQEYQEYIQKVILFLSGKYNKLLRQLTQKMKHASKELKFEVALKIKRQIESIQEIHEKQRVYSLEEEDVDVVGYFQREEAIIISLLFIREGKLLGKRTMIIKQEDEIQDEVQDIDKKYLLREGIKDYYRKSEVIPEEVIVPFEPLERELLENYLSALKKEKVKLTVGRQGKKKAWIELAVQNARFGYIGEKKLTPKEFVLNELKTLLQLEFEPRRIEGFDISNTQGEESVGGMVRFYNGKKDKKGYRHFKIKTVEGANDPASLAEVIGRRYQNFLEGSKSSLPDLILVDGGKGQVNGAKKVLDALNLKIPLIGLAKKEEEIFFPNNKQGLKLAKNSNSLRLLQEVRDESHRFSNSYHRKLRSKALFESKLEEIEGVGKVRRKLLLKHFRTLANLQKASLEELKNIERMDHKTAKNIYNFLN